MVGELSADVRRLTVNSREWKRHEKRKASKAEILNRQREAQEQGEGAMHVHILPENSSVEELARTFMEVCDPDGCLLVVIHTQYGTGMRVVLPEERRRLEREEPQIRGKVMVCISEEQAHMWNVL